MDDALGIGHSVPPYSKYSAPAETRSTGQSLQSRIEIIPDALRRRSDAGNQTRKESQAPTQDKIRGELTTVVESAKYAFEKIEKIAERESADILFIVGMTLLAATYALKFLPQLFLTASSPMSETEFALSLVVALVFLVGGAVLRYMYVSQELLRTTDVQSKLFDYAEIVARIHQEIAADASQNVDKAQQRVEDQTKTNLPPAKR